MQRVVFVNLHCNSMLVKTMNKFIYKQSAALKHKYLLDYLLDNPEYEVCTYINEHGFSMASELNPLLMKVLRNFRFLENRIVLKKNNVDSKKITVLRNLSDIKPTDIVLAYRNTTSCMYNFDKIDAFRAISMIHFWGKRSESKLMESLQPDILFNEVDLNRYSEIFQRFYGWYKKDFIVHPFVFQPRFQRIKPFAERQNKAFATGTITYKNDPDFLEVYGEPCDQPARKQIKDDSEFFKDTIDCTSIDYNEDHAGKELKKTDNAFVSFYKKLYNKRHQGQQKKYFSFNMVEKFNDYKMCIVGEEVLGIPGIGFVEGMACGAAYIGQTIGYYEDYGMKAGVHYIGYDGTKEDLKRVIEYYQMPEHQEELEQIAKTGCEFVHKNFCGHVVAERLIQSLKVEQQKWLKDNK